MPGRNLLAVWSLLLALLVVLLWANVAQAYVGPGSGLELSGYFMSLIAWVLVAFSSLLLWPFYALLRRLRGNKGQPTAETMTPLAAPLVEEVGDRTPINA